MKPFISALGSTVIGNSALVALPSIPVGGIHDDTIKQWKEFLSSIKASLENAEERRWFREPVVRQWLRDLQNLAYEIEDLVDDLDTDFQRQMMDEPESSRPRKLLKLFSGIFSRFTTTYATNIKIVRIINSFLELEKTKYNPVLQNYFRKNSDRTIDLRDPSSSFVDQPFVYGREDDSGAIMKWLLEDRTRKLSTITIVGMGGIGKTTLAQCVYNNEQVRACFHDRMWVSVTEDFDVFKIWKSIYEHLYDKSCIFSNLNLDKVEVGICKKLSNKKFLLVLDDVWNQDYAKWDRLSSPFRVGAPGSMIIVTTRNHNVAKIMDSKEVYDLPVLSDGDCFSLLARQALQRPNFDMHPQLREVGEVIAKRCKGLPLVAESLGNLLSIKPRWIKVATSKLWELESNPIIPDLKLSYHHLPPYLKPLFAYSSLFPKGYEFDKKELILLWMAQGFLNQSPRWRQWQWRQWQMEELGSEYFNDLLSMSFFQRSTGNKSRFIMHDLNNDLAQFVAGLTCLRLDDETMTELPYNVYKEARHASFISHEYGDFKKFKAFNAAQCLRTLLPIREKFSGRSYLNNLVLKDFPRLLCLRAVSFNGYRISELPESIGDLNHLRYLDVSRTDITELPECVSALSNLQTLLLYGCHELVQLPTSIKKLINLRHLDVSDTPSLKVMPLGIGLLTHLRTLSKFIVDRSERKITELKGLRHLQGTLSIIGIENVMNVEDAMGANLLHKEGLHGLEMKWSNSFGGTREGLEFEVLDALTPHTGLTSLEIEFYGGHLFPSWVGDHSFCDMVKMSFIGCRVCTYLPPLGQLTSLKELYIKGMDGVKVVGPEFFRTGSHDIVPFQSLTSLNFMDMDCWEEWFSDSTRRAFPRLEELQISGCMKLNKVSLAKIPSLEVLEIRGCNKIILRCMVQIGSVKKLVLGDISGLSKLDEGIIRCLGALEILSVYNCDQLRYLWEEEVACQVLEKLKSLTVKSCQQLESLGDKEELLPHNLEILESSNVEKMPNWQNSLTSLRQLTIKDCKRLPNLAWGFEG